MKDNSNINQSDIVNDNTNCIDFKISCCLFKKIDIIAKSEGVKSKELIEEFIAEGVVLKAWDIVERKRNLNPKSNFNKKNHYNNKNFNRNNGNRKKSYNNKYF